MASTPRIDWHRAAAIPVFSALLALAFWTGEARVVIISIITLAWPFVFIWYGDDLAQTTGLHWGLVDRPSKGSYVRIGGWVILGIYLGGGIAVLR